MVSGDLMALRVLRTGLGHRARELSAKFPPPVQVVRVPAITPLPYAVMVDQRVLNAGAAMKNAVQNTWHAGEEAVERLRTGQFGYG